MPVARLPSARSGPSATNLKPRPSPRWFVRILVALLFLALPLAGCIDSDPDALVVDEPDLFARKPALEFRPVVDLGSKAGIMDSGLGAVGTSCTDSVDDGDCGLGEPTLEVDGAGTVYVSGVCCLTVAPPVLVSRDGGATFSALETPGVREAFGIEGDFAVDAEGRVYFSDIEFAGTFQVTVWDKDGNYIRHTKWPAPPLVDRDWIRAEGDGTAYYIYNTGAAGTRVYKSTDAGMTWSPDAIHVVPYALGNVALDPGREICLFGGALEGFRRLDCSLDGGATWTTEKSTLPVGDDAYPVGAYDESGTLFLAESIDGQIHYTYRTAEGDWSDDVVMISDGEGDHRMPWIAAGATGAAAIAWYATTATDGNGDWFVHAAASREANAEAPRWDAVIADPEPVFKGALGRDLLDFLQVELGPDGAIHIAYSKLRAGQGPDGNEEQLQYVRSEASPLAAIEYAWGPQSEA